MVSDVGLEKEENKLFLFISIRQANWGNWCKSINFRERTSEWHNKKNGESLIHRQGWRGLQSTGAQMTTYIIAPKFGNEDVNYHPADGESWRRNQMQAVSICYIRRENTVSNFSTAGTWTITRWDSKICQATLQWVNSNVGTSPLPTRYPLSGIIYCKTENPCEGGQLSDRAQWSIHEGFRCAKNELWPFSKGLLQGRKCFHLQGRSWYGKVKRVGRQTASANEYPSILDQCS